MARCRVCGSRSPLTASSLGACARCIRAVSPELHAHLVRAHTRSRRAFGLPPEPPRDPHGIPCDLCAIRCQIPPDQAGYFGGDPSPQFPHSVAASALARRRAPQRILRICWETNGTMHPRWLRQAMTIALESG